MLRCARNYHMNMFIGGVYCSPRILKQLVFLLALLQFSISQRSWTDWSSCTAPCGPGVQHRYLRCLPSAQNCYGNQKQYKVCSIQECEGKGGEDYRSSECRKYNAIKHRGRFFQWEKYILPSRQCSLTCRAAYYGFHETFQGAVRDGIPCDGTSSDQVCIQGRCTYSWYSSEFMHRIEMIECVDVEQN